MLEPASRSLRRRPGPIALSSPVSSPTSPEPTTPAGSDAGAECLGVGASVRLVQRPAYLKSADPMPMLRPPDLIDEAETGTVVELRALGQRAVRFRRGTFLLEAGQLRPVDAD